MAYDKTDLQGSIAQVDLYALAKEFGVPSKEMKMAYGACSRLSHATENSFADRQDLVSAIMKAHWHEDFQPRGPRANLPSMESLLRRAEGEQGAAV